MFSQVSVYVSTQVSLLAEAQRAIATSKGFLPGVNTNMSGHVSFLLSGVDAVGALVDLHFGVALLHSNYSSYA